MYWRVIFIVVIFFKNNVFFGFYFYFDRHQYEAYKQQLLQSNGIPPRERSPRARRFFHRRQPRNGMHSGRNDGIRNDRGRRRRKPNVATASDTNNPEPIIENSENRPKSRRQYNRGRKSKQLIDSNKNDDNKPEQLQLTESNLTTLLSELNMGGNTLNTANSTSSDSLDFEKINSEDTNLCSPVLQSAASRLAATFSKGN